MLKEVTLDETKEQADEAIDAFDSEFALEYDRAVQCLVKDRQALLTYFDFPALLWKHLRTTNIIESPFATVRLRHRVTKGAGNRTKALTMAFTLLEMAQMRFRRLDGTEMLPVVRTGGCLVDWIQIKRDNAKEAA